MKKTLSPEERGSSSTQQHCGKPWFSPTLSFPYIPIAHHSRRLGDSLPVSLLVAANILKILDDVDFNSSLSHLAERSPSQDIIF